MEIELILTMLEGNTLKLQWLEMMVRIGVCFVQCFLKKVF